MKTALKKIRETLQTHVYVKVGALIVSFIIAGLSTALIGVETVGRSYAQAAVIEMVRPVTDSIKVKQAKAEVAVVAIQDSLHQLRTEGVEIRHITEISIAAQRQADPKYDRALQDMARADDEAWAKEEENRKLIKRLTGRRINQ